MDNINTTKGEEIKEREQATDEQVKEFDETIKKVKSWAEYKKFDLTKDDDITQERAKEVNDEFYKWKRKFSKQFKDLQDFYKRNGVSKKEQLKGAGAYNVVKGKEEEINDTLEHLKYLSLDWRSVERINDEDTEEYNKQLKNYIKKFKRLEKNKYNDELLKIFTYYTDDFYNDPKDLIIDNNEDYKERLKVFYSDIIEDIESNEVNNKFKNSTEQERKEVKTNLINDFNNLVIFELNESIKRDYNRVKKGINKSEKTEEEKQEELKKLYKASEEVKQARLNINRELYRKYINIIKKEDFENATEIKGMKLESPDLCCEFLNEEIKKDLNSFKTDLLKFDYNNNVEFSPATINIIAGRPGAGKTTLMINLFLEVMNKKNNCVFMTTEITESQLFLLMIKNRVKTSIDKTEFFKADDGKEYNTKQLKELFKGDFKEYIKHFTKAQRGEVKKDVRDEIIKDCCNSLNIEICKKHNKNKIIDPNKFKDYKTFLNYLESCDPYTVIFLDYIQNLKKIRTKDNTGADIKNSFERIEQTLEDIDEIAKNNNLIIILGSQFNRDTENELNLNNLAKSGKLEQIATVVIGLGKYTEKGENEPKYFYKLLKNRFGDCPNKDYYINNELLKYCLYLPTNEVINITQDTTTQREEETKQEDNKNKFGEYGWFFEDDENEKIENKKNDSDESIGW